MLLKPAAMSRPGSDDARIAALDMLRALAVFLVIGHHAAWRFRPAADDAIGMMFRGSGWIGVDIFFVISGFMITRIFLSGSEDVRGFFIRRAYRILPIFVVAIVLFMALSVATGQGSEKLHLMWSPALMLNGWSIPFLGYGNVPYTITWSLSVEETAYIIMGLAFLAGRRGVVATLALFLLLGPLTRLSVLASGAFPTYDLYFFVPARLDSIAFGGVAAWIFIRGARAPGWVRPVAGIAMMALVWWAQYVPVSDSLMVIAGYTIFGVVTAVFVLALADFEGRGGLIGRAVARFGRLSYFIYLFHIFVLEGLLLVARRVPALSLGYWQAVLLATLIVFAMASVSWRFFEYPLIRRGRALSQGKVAQPAAAVGVSGDLSRCDP